MASREFPYRCLKDDCLHEFSERMSVEEQLRNPVIHCPACASLARRIYSMGGFSFKGGKPSAHCSNQRYKV